MIDFDYRQERLRSGRIISRPVAKVALLRSGKADDEWISEFFYVDSGADYTLVPYRFGQFLGLEDIASDTLVIGGVGGNVDVRFADFPMRIEQHEFDCTVAWAQEERVPFLLGRENVFDRFDITFRQRVSKVVFKWNSL